MKPTLLALACCLAACESAASAPRFEPPTLTDLDPDPSVLEVELVAGLATHEYLPGRRADVRAFRDGAVPGSVGTGPGPMHRPPVRQRPPGRCPGVSETPTDTPYPVPVMAADIQARYSGKQLMVVSPDVGGVVRARALAKRLDNAPLAIVDKRRDRPGESEVMNIIGDVGGRHCILIDDIIDSGGTLFHSAQALPDPGRGGVGR